MNKWGGRNFKSDETVLYLPVYICQNSQNCTHKKDKSYTQGWSLRQCGLFAFQGLSAQPVPTIAVETRRRDWIDKNHIKHKSF